MIQNKKPESTAALICCYSGFKPIKGRKDMSYSVSADLGNLYPIQAQHCLEEAADYVLEEYGSLWSPALRAAINEDAYDNLHYPIFNQTERFVYYYDAYVWLLEGCEDAHDGARRILDTCDVLNALDVELMGEVYWSREGVNSCVMANTLFYYIGYHVTVPRLEELNGMFREEQPA
jgi:hypothetical protein